MLRTYGCFVALALLAACAAPAAEDVAGSSEDAIAVAKIDNVCSPPFVSPDGRKAVAVACMGSQDQVIELDIETGTKAFVGTVTNPQRVTAIGAGNGVAWYTSERADHSWQITIKTAGGTRTVAPAFSAGATGDDVRAPIWAVDTSVVTDRYVALRSMSGRFLIVVETTGTTPAAVFDLGAARSFLLPAPDGRRVLVASGVSGTLGGTVTATFRTLDLSGPAPELGAPVTSAQAEATLVDGSYDGQRIVVLGKIPPFVVDTGVISIDTTTGARTVLADGVKSVQPIAVRDGYVWYAAQRGTGYTLERASYTDVPVTLATGTRPIDGRLSTDGTSIVFRTGEIGERMTLSTVPSDGSGPARLVWNEGGDLMFRASSGGRTLFLMRKGGESFEYLVDDATGEPVRSYQHRSWQDTHRYTMLARDGSAMYITRVCKVGAIDGVETVRVGATEEVLVPCGFGTTPGARFVTVPESGAVLGVNLNGPNQLVLLKP